jgi:CelD/BcsL family acetyltransferase involved in cellulose biosynthesis
MNNKSKLFVSGKPLCHLNQLPLIEKSYREIFQVTCSNSTFLSFEYITLWYNCFAKPDQVRVYTIDDGSRIIGFLPLVLRKKGPISVLSSLTNDHCLHSDPLILDGYEKEFVKYLVFSLLAGGQSWDVFTHEYLYSFSNIRQIFKEGLTDSSGVVIKNCEDKTYSIVFAKPFERYYREDLSQNVRKNFMRYKNRLNRAGKIEFVCHQNQDAIEHWQALLEIEGSGWKGKEKSSINQCSADIQKYYDGLLQLLSNNKALFIFFLKLDSKLIAGAFGYVDRKTFHWAKTGYDEKYGQYSPANILLLNIIEYLLRERPEITRFHLFPWDNGYKHRYINEESFFSKTTIYNKTVFGSSTFFLTKVKERIKQYPGVIACINVIKKKLQEI